MDKQKLENIKSKGLTPEKIKQAFREIVSEAGLNKKINTRNSEVIAIKQAIIWMLQEINLLNETKGKQLVKKISLTQLGKALNNSHYSTMIHHREKANGLNECKDEKFVEAQCEVINYFAKL